MKKQPFTINYINVKNSFIYLSERWLKMVGDFTISNTVLKLEYGNGKCCYCSWSSSPAVTVQDDVVSINGAYARALGLKDGQTVLISDYTDVGPVNRIHVSPLTEDDWAILMTCSDIVQSSLLEQLRVVWHGQNFVFCLSQSFQLVLCVDALESSQSIGRLEPFTEVVVSPPKSDLDSVDNNIENNVIDHMSDCNNISRLVSSADKDNEHLGIFTSALRTLTNLVFGSRKNYENTSSDTSLNHCNNSKNTSYSSIQKYCKKQNKFVCRVHPLQITSIGKEVIDSCLFYHPYNVYIHKSNWDTLGIEQPQDICTVIICKVTKAPFSKTNSSTPSFSSGDEDIKVNSVEQGTTNVAYARLCVFEDMYQDLPESLKEVLAPIANYSAHKCAVITDLLTKFLGLTPGCRIVLEVISAHSAMIPTEIQISSMQPWNEDSSHMDFIFRRFLEDSTKMSALLLNNKAVVTLSVFSSTRDILIEMLPPNLEYAIFNKNCSIRCKISQKKDNETTNSQKKDNETTNSPKTNDETIKSLSGTSKPVTTKEFKFSSGMQNILTECVTTLELSLLLYSPLSSPHLLDHSIFISNILILGKAGSGKSTLANEVCKLLSKSPYFVYVHQVHCKHLKGKNVETLMKLFTQALSQCVYYQPAVILFDDLDALLPICEGDEVSQDELYHSRLGSHLVELLEAYQSLHYITVMATAMSIHKLHSSIISPRGQHIVKTILDIPEMDKLDRLEILSSIISQKSFNSTSSLDLDTVVNRTEGYVIQDLVDIVDKATFQSLRRSVVKREHPILLDQDFEEAIDNFVPLSLQGVQFFHDSSRSWDDVGGLKDVKQILVEVLQWPSQYPDLYAQCPLRHQSGVLLYGAPGTGKTLLAGVVAHECGLKFISVKGPELLSKYIGASEEAVRNIFQKAQSAKPCVLFFDEFDSLAPRRGHDSTGVTDRVVNQLLTQLDGVESLQGVWVIAATSRPDLLDPALLRPGRLDRAVLCPLPDEDDRLSILQSLSRRLTLDADVDLKQLAASTKGFTGADLQAILYTAQLMTYDSKLSTSDEDMKYNLPDLLPFSEEPASGSDTAVLDEDIGPIITQALVQAALKDTRPSLSPSEKHKYRKIYDKFSKPRRGMTQELSTMPQRATLA